MGESEDFFFGNCVHLKEYQTVARNSSWKTHLRRELRYVHYSPEMKTQLQMSNGAITGSEDQLTQHFQMMQFAGREMFSISVTLKLHFERAGKWKTQMVDPDSCKSSGSACG